MRAKKKRREDPKIQPAPRIGTDRSSADHHGGVGTASVHGELSLETEASGTDECPSLETVLLRIIRNDNDY